MEREVEVLKTLLGVNRLIGSNSQMTTVVKRITAELRKILRADACSLMLLDPMRRELAFMASSGLTRWETANIRFKIGEGVAGWVARHKQPILIARARDDPRFIHVPGQRRRMESMISVPLLVHRRLMGVITLTTREGTNHHFDDDDLELTILVGAHISLAIENTRLYEVSVLDGLTNVYNRRFFMQHLQEKLAYCRRFHQPLTLVMSDLDWFKEINDSQGHLAGDQVLRHIAAIYARTIRQYDIVARYGGEEFAVILPSLDKGPGASVAERLRRTVEEEPLRQRDLPIRVTASFGVAAFPQDAESAEELIHKADLALYQAKERGRNQVAMA